MTLLDQLDARHRADEAANENRKTAFLARERAEHLAAAKLALGKRLDRLIETSLTPLFVTGEAGVTDIAEAFAAWGARNPLRLSRVRLEHLASAADHLKFDASVLLKDDRRVSLTPEIIDDVEHEMREGFLRDAERAA